MYPMSFDYVQTRQIYQVKNNFAICSNARYAYILEKYYHIHKMKNRYHIISLS